MKLTDGLEGNIGEHCTEVVVEEAFEDVERDVREAGVNVGVDSQDDSVSPDDAARDNVSLMAKKHVLFNSTSSSFVLPLDGIKVQRYTCSVLGVTSLGQRTKRRGTVTMMEQNVTQKTTSERLNTSRSPDGRTQDMWILLIQTDGGLMSEDRTGFLLKTSVPRGVKRTVEAMRKPSISPTTTTHAMMEPNRHQLMTRRTPPTTPITADTARQTAGRDAADK